MEEAKARLDELIDQLGPGQGLVITRGARSVARIVKEQEPAEKPRPIAGRGKGKLIIVSDDDGHLEGFAGYT